MTEEKIQRINELSKKKAAGTLTPEEQAEQKALYEEYLKGIRRNIRMQMGTYKKEDFGD